MNNYRNEGRFGGGLGYSNVSRQGGFTPTRSNAAVNLDFQESHVGQHNLGELEQILYRERTKFKYTREKLEAELDVERKKRIEFENKLIKVKDYLSRKDLSISYLEFHRNNLLHKNQDLSVDNEKLEGELQRLEYAYGGRITSLQAELDEEARLHEEEKEAFGSYYYKLKKEGQEYVEGLIFEYDRRLKSLEEKLRASEASRKELTFDNKKLNDSINQNRMAFEYELRDAVNRVREEYQRNIAKLARSHEQKLKTLEYAKESLNRRCQEYHRLIQYKDRQIEYFNNSNDSQEQKLRQYITDLGERISQMNFLCDKLKTELNYREAILSRIKSEAAQYNLELKQQLQERRKEIERYAVASRNHKQQLKDLETEYAQKLEQLQYRANYFEQEARKHKDDFNKVFETLKSKVNETITSVGYKR